MVFPDFQYFVILTSKIPIFLIKKKQNQIFLKNPYYMLNN